MIIVISNNSISICIDIIIMLFITYHVTN